MDLVAMEPPEVADHEYLFQYFQKDDWARLLPILHFFSELTRSGSWTPPPVRACFMFDDPNLHWKSYGYVNYQQLAHQAREQNIMSHLRPFL